MSTRRLTTISNQTGSASVPSDTVINGSAKAWVNFNGTGTVAIRASFNVSSITDNGTGNYFLNFTNPMQDTSFVTAGSFNWVSNGNGLYVEAPSSTALVKIQTLQGNSVTDFSCITVAVHR